MSSPMTFCPKSKLVNELLTADSLLKNLEIIIFPSFILFQFTLYNHFRKVTLNLLLFCA